MSRRKRNTRLQPWGIEVFARVNKRQVQTTFPHGTPTATIDAWLATKAQERLAAREASAYAKTTLSGCVDAYLLTLGPVATIRKKTGLPDSRTTTKRRISANTWLSKWTAAFPDRVLLSLSYADCRDFLASLQAQSYTASSINKARSYFVSLWRWVQGSLDGCPACLVAKLTEPPPLPRAQDPALLWRAVESLQANVTRARLKMLLSTGMRPDELMRVEPEDLHHQESPPWMFGRSAKGGNPRVIPLNADGVAAVTEFADFVTYGSFSSSSLRTSLLAGLTRQGLTTDDMIEHTGQPRRRPRWKFQPYVLRHTFATSLRAAGADLADVQDILGHRNARTTQRYAPTVKAKLVEAVTRVERDVTRPPLL